MSLVIILFGRNFL